MADDFKNIDDMTTDEIKEDLIRMRNMWSWLPAEMQLSLLRVGQMTRVVTRNYKGYVGDWMFPEYEMKTVKILCVNPEFDFVQGKQFIEQKFMELPFSNVVQLEFIQERDDSSNLEEIQANTPGFLEPETE